MSFSDVAVAVGSQRPSKKCINHRYFERILEIIFGQEYKDMLHTRQIVVVGNFRLRQREGRLILHKICYFQPFLKFQVSKNFSSGLPFAEMPKMSNFLV